MRTLEELAALVRITLAANGVKASKLPDPLIVPRPGTETKPIEEPPPPHPRGWMYQLMRAKAEGVQVVSVGG